MAVVTIGLLLVVLAVGGIFMALRGDAHHSNSPTNHPASSAPAVDPVQAHLQMVWNRNSAASQASSCQYFFEGPGVMYAQLRAHPFMAHVSYDAFYTFFNNACA